MADINIIDEFYIPLLNQENMLTSKEYKLLKDNNVDTAELEGNAVHPASGEVKLGEVTDDEKRTLGMDVMEYIKAMPRDLVVSVVRGGMNGFDFVNDVAAFATYGNRKVPEDSVFKFVDERIEAQQKSLNEIDKDDPLTTRIIGALGQDAAFVYPIYKKVKSIGIPKQYALPVSFALGSTLAFDKKASFMVDTDAINGLKTAVGIDDDTPADELFDKTVQALEFGAMGIALDKIFPIIKNIKKFRRADQAAVSVGGAAAAGAAVDAAAAGEKPFGAIETEKRRQAAEKLSKDKGIDYGQALLITGNDRYNIETNEYTGSDEEIKTLLKRPNLSPEAIKATGQAAAKAGEFLKSQGIDTNKGDTLGKAR